ncbi:hypothetical protein [Brachyspira hampsonii]|uniref:Uncharacterized protein n=1 Tax=Brachyspira hampsonii 30446 TaxID=1289135 RepID=A0A2U4EVB8_9SPIR|nr:hypothetical protein [Brachyspira hampsonii]EKV56685.1 hypothetical protein A966_09074 [Brachyspira hampsonii 30446]MBW5390164.1 hypothetical protein [Brachyspira hampsonii]MBW5395755.1 hypothetical protein [Brachyspira hampsonii]OEJ20248.1 hypothetical protein A9495_12560 [Brachyspira hampsonii]PTY40118.1 hypothetical protein DQ06_05830 [Brachyspira hampsonii bv. II]
MNENTSNDINNQLTSVNNKLSRSLNELNNSQQAGGIVGTIASAVVSMKEIEKDMMVIEKQFQYLMKKADIDLEKFKHSFNLTSNMLNNISNNLNLFAQQVLSIPTDTINENEIKHRTELLNMVNNFNMTISQMLINLLK